MDIKTERERMREGDGGEKWREREGERERGERERGEREGGERQKEDKKKARGRRGERSDKIMTK